MHNLYIEIVLIAIAAIIQLIVLWLIGRLIAVVYGERKLIEKVPVADDWLTCPRDNMYHYRGICEDCLYYCGYNEVSKYILCKGRKDGRGRKI